MLVSTRSLVLPRQQLLHVDPKCQYKWQVRDTCIRAERAEAERVTLRKCLKSVVSAWDDDYKPTWYERWQPAIDAARAKVNTTEGEK